MQTDHFPGKVAIQQRVLPVYRAEFFNALAELCNGGVSLFVGDEHAEESIHTTNKLQKAQVQYTRNLHVSRIDSPYYALWQTGFISWLENNEPDILVIEANPRYLSSRSAVNWMHARGKPVVGWGLGAHPINMGSSVFRKSIASWQQISRRNFLHRLDALIAYSRQGAEQYENEGIPAERIYVAPNAVTRKPGKLAPVHSQKFDQKLVILFVGRLQERKKVDNLIIACSHLDESIAPDLWIVGDGPARKSLQSLAGEVYPDTKFFSQLHGEELQKKFRDADLFVLPGTGGLAVQEAMSFGLPVIVAQGDGTQNDLVRRGNGWLIPAGDVASLHEMLSDALSDSNRLRLMGEKSFQIVKDEINVEHMADVFIRVFNTVKFTKSQMR
jgi:glycosyltransferase involved in cell wall biosynthesis